MNARAILQRIEASLQAQDELMARIVAELRHRADMVDEIERLERYRSVTRSAASSFVVEAARLLRDRARAECERGKRERALDAVCPARHWTPPGTPQGTRYP